MWILFLVILVGVASYWIGYNQGWDSARDTYAVPIRCIHGHIDWDDCPVCGH